MRSRAICFATLFCFALASPSDLRAAESRDTTIDAAEAAVAQTRLRDARAAFPAYFAEAYARHPALPAGSLEAIAWVQSRWQHRGVDTAAANAGHHGIPVAHGLMGLYAGDGFADQVGEAAVLLGTTPDAVMADPRTNVLAAAALLERALAGRRVADLEALAPALQVYAGFTPGAREVDAFARASFAFDVLLTLDRGIDDEGARVPERAVRWERAFDAATLARVQAPFVRIDLDGDRIEADGHVVDPVSGLLVPDAASTSAAGPVTTSTDYGPAIWDPASSSNYNASRSAAIDAVTIHTAQGSYAGTISWFKNATAGVSAHYVIRSSDGQVTQMVRNAHTAWHVRSHNSSTLGIEHEGYVDNAAWYTSAMYTASAALVRSFCANYAAVSCASAYSGAPSSGINVLATSVKVKGHQHFSGQTHTDPGINWNWSTYYGLLNPGGGGSTTLLDTFESSVGRFNTSPAYSGSTTGIAASSSAQRTCTMAHGGACSLQVYLVDNAASSANWAVRLLSGSGVPSANATLTRANGRVGFWVFTSATGMSAAIGIDDSDGTERSISRAIPASTWTFLEWNLTDAAQWDAWVGGNGAITASTVTLDAIWFYRAQTSYPVYLYVDDVRIAN